MNARPSLQQRRRLPLRVSAPVSVDGARRASLAAVPPRQQSADARRSRPVRARRRLSRSAVDERDADDGAEERASTPILARSPMRRMPWISAALAVGDETEEDGQRQQRDGAGVLVAAEGQHCDRARRTATSSQRAEQRRARRRCGAAPPRCGRCARSSPEPTASAIWRTPLLLMPISATLRARSTIEAYDAHQAEARRAEQHRHGLGAHDADEQVQRRRAADQRTT